MYFVLGIDAATWNVINPNLGRLPAFRSLCQLGDCEEIILKEKPLSPSIWCGIFSGKEPREHGHESFVKDNNIIKREDIEVDFIWDILAKENKNVRVLNVPFIVPPYNFNVDYKNVGFGLPMNEKEWEAELESLTEAIKKYMQEKPDLLIAVYTLLDRVQHFHWGEETVLYWYERLDKKIAELIFETGFADDPDNRLIVISDHGFCSFGESKVQTLPEKTEFGRLKGDHHENALLIRYNIDFKIKKPQDVFFALKSGLL